MMRKLWRYIKWFLLSFLGILLIYLLAALIGSLWSTRPMVQNCAEKQYELYVTTAGVHLDLVLPVEQLPPHLIHPSYFTDSTTHVAFGWGECTFFLETPNWSDLTLQNGARALLVNSESLVHIVRYRRPMPSWKRVEVCEESLAALFEYLDQSFRKNEQGDWTEVPSTGYPRSHFFYEANGQYNAINTCNAWLGEALKAAQVKTGRWSPFTYGILWHLDD
ncbi:MAG: DUF2459 domain-containing protein [Bacteroidota bacterium]